ncbi:MAG: 23S rRNA (adenine(2503)-C(2))-methyltransferase RlmN [Gammaproteobacteria bacterium]|nr:23S rRNA (adenine(2503)-C(2))-methyltransferase RlmN [Gammaproteobacteria bacterium]
MSKPSLAALQQPPLRRAEGAGSGSESAAADARANLLGMPRTELERFFVDLGEKPWRAKQVMKWIYHAGVAEFDAMTDISQALRNRLSDIARIEAPVLTPFPAAADGTRKWSVAVGDGSERVEAVLIPEPSARGSARGRPSQEEPSARGSARGLPSQEEPSAGGRARGLSSQELEKPGRSTLCISSQVGCVLDCAFCATGKQGFNGNLSRAEIVGQAWAVARQLATEGSGRGITNIVFMGMGEPLYNFDAVVDAASVFTDDLGLGISRRRVTISTAGVAPRIRELASRSEVSLAVSLHAAEDELRSQLVPLNRRYPIAELLAACRHWLGQLGDRRSVTIEYTLMEGVNDALADAAKLAGLLGDLRCKVNLIPFNPFPGSQFKRPSMQRVRAFQTHLLGAGIPAMLRTTRGDDITAACGQLVGLVRDRTRRQARHLARRTGMAPDEQLLRVTSP